MNTIRNSICLTIITMVLCGFLFPLAITLIGQIFFYQQANGSLITYDNRIVGSKLIGQHWTESGSNESNGNTELIARVKHRDKFGNSNVTIDAATSSGSGLDPHITVENALKQAHRIADARHISTSRVADLIQHRKQRGVLTNDYVNVLELNIALDKMKD
ncbi:TPA: potassium-transporting ATPase subunit C [Staphylococcus aureus]|nr:potassium-transporting ATPase subunit C [Staphylococcus aureus]